MDVNHLHQTMDGDFAIYGDDEDSGLENGNGHRHLEQRQDTLGIILQMPVKWLCLILMESSKSAPIPRTHQTLPYLNGEL